MAYRNNKKKEEINMAELIAELKVDYPEIKVIEIETMSEIGDGTFVWYQNPTIKETVMEHRQSRGWIPARIYADQRGHYIRTDETHLKPEKIEKRKG